MVALIKGLIIAAKRVNFNTFWVRRKAFRPSANLFIRYAAAKASKVLPNAIPMDEITSPVVVKLTKNAASKITGAAFLYPINNIAAIAIPVGGQIAVALG